MPNDLFSMFQEMDDSNPIEDKDYRAPLNYIGTKRESLSFILPLLKRNNTWIDCFGGSGIVTLSRHKSNLEIWNDRHSGLAAFYMAIQQDVDALIERINLMPHSREMFDYFRDNPPEGTIERGAQWYYIVQTSFGGKSQYWGRVKDGTQPLSNKLRENLKYFHEVQERFKSVQIENRSWEVMFDEYDAPNVTWYLDPPYVDTCDYAHNMTKADHHRLCRRIMELKGFVALSGFNNVIYNEYDWDAVHEVEVRNNIANLECNTKRDSYRKEILWIKE